MSAEELQAAYEERVRRVGLEIEARDQWLALLSAVVTRTHACEESKEIFDIALSEVLSRLDLRAAWVFMGGQNERRLHFAASQGVSQQYLDTVSRVGLDECLCPEVFWTGHRMQARNTTQCPRMPTIIEGLSERVAHACVPLRFEGETRGVLNIAARPAQLFTEDELRFFELLGHQVCIAIERAEHLKAERLRNQEARALMEVNRAIGGSLDPATVLQAVGRSALELLSADRIHVLLGHDPRDLRVAHLSGPPHPELKEGEPIDLVSLSARGHRLVLETGTTLQVDDWPSDPRVDNTLAARWDIASGIILPLVARGRTLGLMALTRRERRPWTPSQRELAESFAAQACLAIDNAHLYDESRMAFENLKGAQGKIVQAEKMATLGTFASGLAHEVRNPLNSISLQLSILERRIKRLERPASEEMTSVTGIIRDEISRLDALVGDFLLFSRGNRVHRSVGSIDDLVDDVVRLLDPESRESGITVERVSSSAAKAPGMPMDPERVKQVILNLLRNAFEATGRGGRVRIETRVSEDEVGVTVQDSGPGLPPGVEIFQLFVTTKPKGTGLGLAIAQQIVADHGGRIGAENVAGGGARFEFALPRNTPPGVEAFR